MNIVISANSNLAIYEQIVMQLKNAIFNHELHPGEALPSIRVLASSLEVSVITTKRAYEELEKENLIRSVAGKGFYVCVLFEGKAVCHAGKENGRGFERM